MNQVISLNIRGLGDDPKYHCLREMLVSMNPFIFFAQETMSDRTKAINMFLRIKRNWHVAATNSCGCSGGLLVMWNPSFASFKAYSFFGGILLHGRLRGMDHTFNFINLYAPYVNRRSFWDRMVMTGIFHLHNLIIMGDFNATFNADEAWGNKARMDPLAGHLNDIFLSHGLIDIRPHPLMPTWTNRRAGVNFIGKRLDRVVVKNSIFDILGGPKSFVMVSDVSDHYPISLSCNNFPVRSGYPFKFNRIWLEDPEYTCLVEDIWRQDPEPMHSELWDSFHHKMQKIKTMTKSWEREKKCRHRAEYRRIQAEMEVIIESFTHTYPDEQTLESLKCLGNRKRELLRIEESTWRLKSRALWLAEGDRNTKFFHKCASERRSKNAIWRIKSADGSIVYSSKDIQNEAIRYFANFYAKQDDTNMVDQAWMLEHIPRFFDDTAIAHMDKVITGNEVKLVLKSFACDKSPGPDGWPAEFYIHFYDLLGEDLTKVIEQIRIRGYIYPNNTRADGLSKMGLFSDFGTMQVQLFRDGLIYWETEIDIP